MTAVNMKAACGHFLMNEATGQLMCTCHVSLLMFSPSLEEEWRIGPGHENLYGCLEQSGTLEQGFLCV